MTKSIMATTVTVVFLALSGCMGSPESDEENIQSDSEALESCVPPPDYPPPGPPIPIPLPPCPDEDGDYVCDFDDVCLGTRIPERVPFRGLAVNHFALLDDDEFFDTVPPPGGPPRIFTIYDTAGCSCEQILYALGGRYGQYRNGCSYGTMQNWVRFVNGGPGIP